MSDQDYEIRLRDKDAESSEEHYLGRSPLYDKVEKDAILNALSLKPADIFLDAGCGAGRLLRIIAKRCKKIYGVDFSSRSIEVLYERARKEGIENIEAKVCNITESIPFQEKVDKILSCQVIQHIPNNNSRVKALLNLYKQLKPNGTCVVSVYNWSAFFRSTSTKEGKFANGLYYFRFTAKEVQALFRECGFRDILVRGVINFKIYDYLVKPKVCRLFYPVAKLDSFLSRFKPSYLFGDFLLVKGIK